MLHKFVNAIIPAAIMALGAGLSGCNGSNFQFGDSEGVPLAELDRSGEAPHSLVLASPDTVTIQEGEALDIAVDGDQAAVDAMRFSLNEGTLAIMRENGEWRDRGKTTVRVTMPSPRSLTLAGSGRIESAALAGDATVVVAGSGTVRADRVAAEKLGVTIAGSGSYDAAGEARTLNLNIAGSGSADMASLKVAKADITVAGSGDARFSSDGEVEASIMGSGDVTVIGRAKCKVSSMGSGTLTCRTSEGEWSGSSSTSERPDAPPEPRPAA